MSRTLSRAQLATGLGVDQRTVTRWVDMGCPHSRIKRRLLFNETEVRAWCAQHGLALPAAAPAGDGAPPSAPRAPLAMADLARKLTLAKRSELELAAERGLKDLGLDEKIRKARTFEEYAALAARSGRSSRTARSPPTGPARSRARSPTPARTRRRTSRAARARRSSASSSPPRTRS